MPTKELEYKGRKLVTRQYANGWQLEVRPLQGELIKQATIFRELSDAIEEAKKVVDSSR
jgi:hypothetical protein